MKAWTWWTGEMCSWYVTWIQPVSWCCFNCFITVELRLTHAVLIVFLSASVWMYDVYQTKRCLSGQCLVCWSSWALEGSRLQIMSEVHLEHMHSSCSMVTVFVHVNKWFRWSDTITTGEKYLVHLYHRNVSRTWADTKRKTDHLSFFSSLKNKN